MNNQEKIKVVILVRVLFHYRIGLFEKLSEHPELDIHVLHGCSFSGTKVVNSNAPHSFRSHQMKSLPIKVNTVNGLAVAPLSPALLFKLWQLKPHVVICEGASNLPNNILCYVYGKLFGAKLIQWGLGELKNRKKSMLRRSLDWLIEHMERTADACITYSSRGAAYYRRIGIENNRIFIAVNVVDTDRIAQRIKKLDSKTIYQKAHTGCDFIVLFVGAINSVKRVDMLIHAFDDFLSRTEANAKLVIVGDGDQRKALEELANSKANRHSIEFAGQVIDGVSAYFSMADIFALPGLGGLAVSEALAHGIPVIASIGDGCEADLLSYGGGVVDENMSVNTLSEHLVYLLKNGEQLKNMRENAIKTINERFNIFTYRDEMVSAIKYAKYGSNR